jgi:hypothetical protein
MEATKSRARVGGGQLMTDEVPTYMQSFGFEPLGYAQAKGSEPRYIFKTPAGIIIHRGVVLASLPGLLSLNPDLRFWRKNFPKPGGRVDTPAAAGVFIRECHIIGRIELPPEHMPRPAGRPRKDRK